MMLRLSAPLAALLVGLATAIVLLAVSILPFLNPVWVGFEQGRAEAAAWTGYTPGELREATDSILADLLLGPPEFDVVVRGEAVLNAREREHMRDVRGVLGAFALVAVTALGILVVAIRIGRETRSPWRRIRRGALATALVTAAGGVVALLAFDAAFELFHRALFPPGSYTFDPGTERLVQLFPYLFWVETAIGIGSVLVALSLSCAWVAGRRAGRSSASAPLGGGADGVPGAVRAPGGGDQAARPRS